MIETIGLIVCTTGKRPEQLKRCQDSFMAAMSNCQNKELRDRIHLDFEPSKDLAHIVKIRNRATDICDERWAFLCDDDDFVLSNHAQVLLAARANHPNATVILSQAKNVNGLPMGFTLSCSLINLDRFRMVNWLCPHEGGEDFFTLSTLAARGHCITREPIVTWQVCDDVPSLTREKRIELTSK